MVEQRHAHLERMAHADRVGVTEQRIDHIRPHLQARYPGEAVQAPRLPRRLLHPRTPWGIRFRWGLRPVLSSGGRPGEEFCRLFGREQGPSIEIRMWQGPGITPQPG